MEVDISISATTTSPHGWWATLAPFTAFLHLKLRHQPTCWHTCRHLAPAASIEPAMNIPSEAGCQKKKNHQEFIGETNGQNPLAYVWQPRQGGWLSPPGFQVPEFVTWANAAKHDGMQVLFLCALLLFIPVHGGSTLQSCWKLCCWMCRENKCGFCSGINSTSTAVSHQCCHGSLLT